MPFIMRLDGDSSIEETIKVMEYVIQREEEEKEKQEKEKEQDKKS